MSKTVPEKSYKHNDPFRPFTELTWQLVASMLYEHEATPAEIASLFNRDVNDVTEKIQKAYASGHLQKVIRSLPDDIPEQIYRDLAARILSDTYKDAKKIIKKRKKTVKACRAAVRAVLDIKRFVNSDWADTLCTTANVDFETYRDIIERELDKFWAGVNCPLAQEFSQWVVLTGADQEQHS
jgi:hypothetical protein